VSALGGPPFSAEDSAMKNDTTLACVHHSILLSFALIELIKSLAGMCADKNVRRLARSVLIGVWHVLDSIPVLRSELTGFRCYDSRFAALDEFFAWV
jgi:hypothetical protein